MKLEDRGRFNMEMRQVFSSFLLAAAFAAQLTPFPAAAQLSGFSLFCDEYPDRCSPSFPLYCYGGASASLRFGLDENFDFEFQADFAAGSPADKFELYFANGPLSPGASNEIRITRLSCGPKEGGGERCSGGLSLERARKITDSGEFDFDQAVITVALREGRKDVCLGKFTNDPDKITSNSRLTRSYCSFTPNQDNPAAAGVRGGGYFDPMGYGTEGEAHLHLTIENLPSKQPVKGCVARGANHYREVLEFNVYKDAQSDSTIYSRISDQGRTKLADEALDYSYDFYRSLQAAAGPNVLFRPTLSQINRQVSPAAARNEREDSRRRAISGGGDDDAQKRKERRKGRRTARGIAAAAEAGDDGGNERIFAWLGFDPLAGDVLWLAPACAGNVPAKAFGSVHCAAGGTSDGRRCVSAERLAGPETAAATVCLEPHALLTLLVLRSENLLPGSYYLCLDGQSLSAPLTIAPGSSFSSLQVTDNAAAAERLAATVLYSGDLAAVASAGLAADAACSQILLRAVLR